MPGFLASSGDDAAVKLIVGGLVFVGWVVTQIYGALTKVKDKRLPPTPAKARPSAKAPAPAVMRQTKAIAKGRRPTPAPQRPAPAPAPVRPPTLRPPVDTAPPSRPAARQSPIVMLRPQNLKAAFILTEVLRPPLALRSLDDDRST